MARSGTSWQQGQSGNPSGRPKMTAEEREARAALRRLTPKLVARIDAWLDDEDPRFAVPAMKVAAERLLPVRQMANPFELPDDIAELEVAQQLRWLREVAQMASEAADEMELAEARSEGAIQ